MSDRMIHKFDDGKYTVIFEGGKLRAERHGTPWRSMTGDGMVLAMLQEVDSLKAKVEELSCREHDLLKQDTDTQVGLHELREGLVGMQDADYGIPHEIVNALLQRMDEFTNHRHKGKTWEEATNVPTR